MTLKKAEDSRVIGVRPAWQTVLLAAHGLGPDEFTEADLTVACWKLDKDRFGLRGYCDVYPDHKRVSMEMMGQKPNTAVGRGYLRRVGNGTLKVRITKEGRTMAEAILNPKKATVAVPSGVGRPLNWQTHLLRIATSRDFAAWKDNSRLPTHRDGVDAALAPCGGLRKYKIAQREIERRLRGDTCAAPLYAPVLADLHDFLTAMWNRFGDKE